VSESPIARRIADEIRRDGPMPFAAFMEHALYAEPGGYYNRERAPIGPEGDFHTASDVGAAFGRALARQLVEIDDAIGPLDPLDVVELGCGRGLLARDMIDALQDSDPDRAARLRYTMVDRSPAMRDRALARAPEARAVAPDGLEAGRRGLVLAVELFDALPVHRLRRRDGELVELHVGLDDDGGLVEIEAPCTEAARALAERYGAAAREGEAAEVAAGVEASIEAIDRCLDKGVVVIVDYGDRAERLYGTRPAGTLLAYRGHRTNQDYLAHVGEQDLTAHVNFSAVEDAARARGFELLGLTTQDRFLIGNGLLEAFEQQEGAARNDPRRVKERLQALQLIHPDGMGRAFKVLVLAKGCSPRLRGLSDPFA
jgi:SAM-dependent MidA family methyltransferase